MFSWLWRKKFVLALWAVAFGGLLALYTFVIPTQYRAKAVLLLPIPDAGSLGAGIGSLPMVGSDINPLTILQGILTSQPAQKYVAEKTGKGLLEVQNNVSITTDDGTQQISISWDDTDKDFGLKLVQHNIDILTRLAAQTDFEMAKMQYREMERSIDAQARSLKEIEDQIVKFQKGSLTAPDPNSPFSSEYLKRLRTIELDLASTERDIAIRKEQTRDFASRSSEVPTGLTTSRKWRDRLVELEYNLRVAETKFGPLAPDVVALKKQIEETKLQISSEIQKELLSVQSNLDPELAELEAKRLLLTFQRDSIARFANLAPQEAVEFQRLTREADIRGNILKAMRSRYEDERLKSQIAQIKWSVLAPPYIEPKSPNKTYVRNTLLGILLGLLIGSIVQIRALNRQATKA